MVRISLALLILILFAGCGPRVKTIDVTTLDGCDGFDWNGRVTVRKVDRGIFTGYVVDQITLESRDGRTVLLETGRSGVDVYVGMPGQPQPR